MSEWEIITLLLIAAHVVLGFVATVYVSTNRAPSAAVAWVLAIIFIPFLGALWYLLVGAGRLPRARRDKQREVSELILARTEGLDAVSHGEQWPPWLATAARMNLALGALPIVGGNRAELLPDYEGSIARMAAEIDTAAAYVHVEFYILVLDDTTRVFFDACGALATAGCRSGCSSTTCRASCSRTAGRPSPRSSRWAPSGSRCSPCDHCVGSGSALICAITASSL